MKKIYLSALTIAICLCSCMSHEDADFSEQDNAAIKENAEKIFGNIDPSQNWSSIKKGTINITAECYCSERSRDQEQRKGGNGF